LENPPVDSASKIKAAEPPIVQYSTVCCWGAPGTVWSARLRIDVIIAPVLFRMDAGHASAPFNLVGYTPFNFTVIPELVEKVYNSASC
jgi:hypothetical protein